MTQVWSTLENVPRAFEKKVYSSAFGCNVLKISMRPISCNVLFKTRISLLILCFDDLSIGVSRVLKFPTIIVLLSISPFMSVSICLMYWGAPMLGEYLQLSYLPLVLIMWCPFLSLVIFFILRSILSDMRIATPAFFCFPFAWNIFSHPYTFSLYVFLGLKWVSCRQHIYGSFSFNLFILIGG